MDVEMVIEKVGPYCSNLNAIKTLLDESKDLEINEIIQIIESRIPTATGTLQTDLKILQNELARYL